MRPLTSPESIIRCGHPAFVPPSPFLPKKKRGGGHNVLTFLSFSIKLARVYSSPEPLFRELRPSSLRVLGVRHPHRAGGPALGLRRQDRILGGARRLVAGLFPGPLQKPPLAKPEAAFLLPDLQQVGRPRCGPLRAADPRLPRPLPRGYPKSHAQPPGAPPLFSSTVPALAFSPSVGRLGPYLVILYNSNKYINIGHRPISL